MSAAEIAEMILALEAPHPLRIGIDGFCAAGKTTLANAVAEKLEAKGRRVIRASADNFQNPPEVRWQLGPRSPEGFFRHAIDFQALRSELLEPLGPTGSRQYRTSTYDIRALRPDRSPQQVAASSAILLLDGLFLHSPQLEGCFEFTIFVAAAYETCIARARARKQEGMADLTRSRSDTGSDTCRVSSCTSPSWTPKHERRWSIGRRVARVLFLTLCCQTHRRRCWRPFGGEPSLPNPSLPASPRPAGREALKRLSPRVFLPLLPSGREGGGEKRAGVMRANGPGTPELTLSRPCRPPPVWPAYPDPGHRPAASALG